MKLSEFYAQEELTPAEKEMCAFLVRTLRQHHATSQNGRRVSMHEMIATVREWAFQVEKIAGRKCDMSIMLQAEALDAAANMLLALEMEWDSILPILHRYGTRLKRSWGAK
jgi:hypothetical protein